MGNIGEDLKDRVRRMRKQAGLSQVALANLAKTSPQTIKDIEAGRKGAGIKVLKGLSEAFNISIEEISGKEELEVERIPKFSPLKAAKYFESVPAKIYELAIKLGPGHQIWDDIEAILEDEVQYGKNKESKNKKA